MPRDILRESPEKDRESSLPPDRSSHASGDMEPRVCPRGCNLDILPRRPVHRTTRQLYLASALVTTGFSLALTVSGPSPARYPTTLVMAEVFLGNAIVLSFMALVWDLGPWDETVSTMLSVSIVTMLEGCAWWYGARGHSSLAAVTMVIHIGFWMVRMGLDHPRVQTEEKQEIEIEN